MTRTGIAANPWQRFCRRIFLGILSGMRSGEILFRDSEGEYRVGSSTRDNDLKVAVDIHDPAFYPAAVTGQSAGTGRAYMEGWWETDDLVALMRIFGRNESVLRRWTGPTVGLLAPLHGLSLWARRNTRAGSRRNIADHYDFGNEFFRTFLDDSMTYSCALFASEDQDLGSAQAAKLDRACRRLALGPDDHVLEIGTGWGSFSIHAAGQYGCRVTTTTLSGEQARFARERIAERGLSDRIEVVQKDYRDLEGRYDKLVSLEMIEAVGRRYYPTYFRQCSDLLQDHGAMLLQAIVVDDRHFDHDARHVDFIKRYIFPGGVLPSIGVIADMVAKHTDLQVADLKDLTAHYAKTLEFWRERLLASRADILAMGHDERVLRLWEFYFAYCEGGFCERRVGNVQVLLVKQGCDLPELRIPTSGEPNV